MRSLLLLVLTLPLAACEHGEPASAKEVAPLDLVSPLEPGQVRAGPVVDENALFAGVSAEGRLGDFKIYNDRVRFIIAGVRESDFMVQQGGAVVDADIVRPEGQPGRDLADEWMPMAGTGHIMEPVAISVLEDGVEGGRAVVRVEGPETPLAYIVGALEVPDLVPDLGLYFVTDYILEPDSQLMEVTTTLRATRGELTINLGDVMMGSKELGSPWSPGQGFNGDAPSDAAWVAFVGRRNEITVGLFALPGESASPHPALGAFSGLISAISACGEATRIPAGGSLSFTRLYGVAADPATLSDAWLALGGEPVERVEGQVTAADGPVEGARVTILLDDLPYTLAFSDSEGGFAADLPADALATPGRLSFVADGHGTGLNNDLPEGAASWSPYAADQVKVDVLSSLIDGAPAVPIARGRGWAASESSPLLLQEPGQLTLRSSDGLPFEARLSHAVSVDTGDSRFVQQTPSGYAALAWARDGELTLPLEPGEYGLTVWRGVRDELSVGSVSIVAGQETVEELSLESSLAPPGWVVVDTHVHASPSPDGGISMEDRVMVSAGVGLDYHISTDHEHIADYRPLLEPLGLDDQLQSIPGNEMSSLIRGHLNLFPLEADPELPNGGAFLWYELEFEDTEQEFALLREWHPQAIIQANHPMSGLASAARWSEGVIGNPDGWCPDFNLVEVANGGDNNAQAFYLDLVRRGLMVAPTSVSDSHSHMGGSPGLNVTYVQCGGTAPRDCDSDALIQAFIERRTIASTGPFLQMSIDPGSIIVGPASLDVEALSPSWIVVDTLSLYKDGELVESVSGTSASFDLDPGVDAVYHVQATGSAAMSPISWQTPWALSSGIFVDVEGDGWDAPYPPLLLSE